MKVLVINGSPKCENSNTMKLTHAFLEGAGWTDAEIVHAIKSDVKPCTGCFSCWNKTPGKCIIRDGMDEIIEKLIVADVVIWAFPLYYFSAPGALKNIIDRQLPISVPFMSRGNESGGHPSRYDLSLQRHIIISNCGFWTAKGNYDAVTYMFDHYYGTGGNASIFCAQGELFNVPELKGRTDAYLEIIKRAGSEFAAGAISAETQAELAEPLYSREVYEKMADASWGIAKNDNPNTKIDDSLVFTKQMAAMYMPDGVERVLEFYYTDANKTYQILLTPKGSEVITGDFRKYTTRIETSISIWRSIARGEIAGEEALFQRKYKVLGDFELMMKWGKLFGESTTQKHAENKPVQKQKSSMLVLLVPWMVIWVTVAINPEYGGIAGIMAAALIPLCWHFFRPVIFEQISIPIIAGLSLAVLLGADARIIIPISYVVFGLMWFIGAFMKKPLSAYYSANSFGGQTAFNNSLFIRTNRILTVAWGLLYLVTPAWTYYFMGTSLSSYIGLINTICPLVMGIFSIWFQRWYPERWARG